MEKNKYLGVSFIVGCLILGISLILTIRSLKSYDRVVSVKGLCEREVMADNVIWPISFKLGGNDLSSLYSEMNDKNEVILSFLEEAGIDESEIIVNPASITDNRANTYNNNARYNYLIVSVITVCSDKVMKVVELQRSMGELIEQGIPIGNTDSWEHKTVFSFTKLNDIKPEMIEEATVNAREAASKFAKDSNSKLGKIKSASQGQFTITDRDSNTPYIKNVRVVNNVVYYVRG